jgi:tetratricopeptide (TPR) repeat protein
VVARLIVASPADLELKRLLAELYFRKGNAYVGQRELVNEGSHQAQAAQVQFLKGIELLEPLIENPACGPKYRDTLAALHNSLGRCLQKDGDLEKGEKPYRQAIKVRAPIVVEEDDLASKLFYMQQLAIYHTNLGIILNMTDRLDQAEKENRQAVKLASEVNTRAPALPGYERGRLPGFQDVRPVPDVLAHAHYHLGNTLLNKGQSRAAEEEFRQTVDFLAQAVEDWPGEITFRGFLAWFRRQYGLVLFDGGKRAGASQQYRKSIEIYHKLQKDSGRELANAEQFIESLTLMGDLLFSEGDREGAAAHYREALDLAEKLAAQNELFEADLAWLLVSFRHPDFLDPARALGLAKKAVDRSKRTEADPWVTLGVAQYRLGQWEDAVASLEQAKKLHREKWAINWVFLAMAQWKLGQKELARASYHRAVKLSNENEYPPAEASHWRAEAEVLLGLNEPKK